MIFVLAKCEAEFRVTTPKLLDALGLPMRPLNARFVDSAERLRGWSNVVILELDGWRDGEHLNFNDRWTILEQLTVMRGPKITLWIKEWDYRREEYYANGGK